MKQMGRGWLWALDKRGIAYRLSASLPQPEGNGTITDESVCWQKTECEVPLRKLAASTTSVWAIGSNSKPYIYLSASDCPCRVTEEVYENQRWYPGTGFVSHLLPTERAAWSDATGNRNVPPELHKLPSSAWEWEYPWMPLCNPRLADKEGWMYAANFSRAFSNCQFPSAFVRRRLWTRTRRYVAVDQWIAIHSKYALLDIAVGGREVPGQPPGFLCVWALTADGKPEGELWCKIKVPVDFEFNHLACSPSSARLFAVTWDGRLIQRIGRVNAEIMGENWAEFPAPLELRFLSVALGDRVVWAMTVDGRVWFARLDDNDTTNMGLNGNSWLDMSCSMSQLSIGPNDQIFGIGLVDDKVYYRTDITEQEPSGRVWHAIIAPIAADEKGSQNQLRVKDELSKPTADEKTITVFSGLTLASNLSKKTRRPEPGDSSLSVAYRRSHEADGVVRLFSTVEKSCAENAAGADLNSMDPQRFLIQKTLLADSEVREEQGSEASDDSGRKESASSGSEVANHLYMITLHDGTLAEDEDVSDYISTSSFASICNRDARGRWFAVGAGGCVISNGSLHEGDRPPRAWFTSTASRSSVPLRSRHNNDHKALWRRSILLTLKHRNVAIWTAFNDFSFAFDRGTWTRTLAAQIWSVYHRKWCEVILQLTQPWWLKPMESESADQSIGLTVRYNDTKRNGCNGKSGFANFQDVLCVRREVDAKNSRYLLVFYISKIEGDPGLTWDFPLKFSCQSEEDQKIWTIAMEQAATRYSHCSLVKSLSSAIIDPVAPNTVWAVASNGAVYVSEPGKKCLIRESHWRLIGGHFRMVEAGIDGIVWALGYDGRPWVFSPSSSSDAQDDTRTELVYENQRWSFFLREYIPLPQLISGYYAWSDESGRISMPKESLKLPGSEWQWLTEWKLDCSLDCYADGWQYSNSFDSSFISEKKFNYSTFRRRRWIRKRRVMTKSIVGSWRLVESNPTVAGREARLDRVIVESFRTAAVDQRDVLVFAITTDGDFFSRRGVCADKPEGSRWQHIATVVPVCDVGLGADRKLWVIGRNGFAYCCYAANDDDLLSSGWHEIVPPENGKRRLKKIAAGEYAVYALDEEFQLYCRLGTTPWCPEGVAWVRLVNTTGTVEHISMSRDNHLWVLLKSSSQFGSAIGRRYDIRGYGSLWDIDWWDTSIVDGWVHVSTSCYTSLLCSSRERKEIFRDP